MHQVVTENPLRVKFNMFVKFLCRPLIHSVHPVLIITYIDNWYDAELLYLMYTVRCFGPGLDQERTCICFNESDPSSST